MDPAVAGLLGAALGSLVGLAGTVVSHWLTVQDKSRATRAEAAVTWIAAEDPAKLTDQSFADYNREMRAFIPEFVGLYANLATIDHATASRMSGFNQDMFVLDMEIARCEPTFRQSQALGAERLAPLLGKAHALFERLLQLVGDAEIGVRPRTTATATVRS